MARRTYHSIGTPGILGVYPSDPEVVGVFPSMSSTVEPIGQKIRIVRGDSIDIKVQIQDEQDPPDKVMIGDTVLGFAVKQGYGINSDKRHVLGNEGANIVKRSYDDQEIEVVNAANGQAIIHLRREDTRPLPLLPHLWDLQLTKAKHELVWPSSASVQLTKGSDVIYSPQNLWEDLKIRSGDLIEVQDRLVLIRSVLNGAQLQVDYSDWQNESSATPRVWEASSRTVASGPFEVMGDIIV